MNLYTGKKLKKLEREVSGYSQPMVSLEVILDLINTIREIRASIKNFDPQYIKDIKSFLKGFDESINLGESWDEQYHKDAEDARRLLKALGEI